MRAYVINESLLIKEIDIPKAEKDWIVIENRYAGINFYDFKVAEKMLKIEKDTPIGVEGAGIVVQTSEADKKFMSKNVAYYVNTIGSFARFTKVHISMVVVLPNTVDFKIAVAVMRKAAIAYLLLKKLAFVKKDDTILIHSVAGGVGHILCQIAKNVCELKVIGTVGKSTKIAFAKRQRCDLIINRSEDDMVKKVADFTNKQGVAVLFDGIGHDVFEDSFMCLSTFGTYFYLGDAGGSIGKLDPILLQSKSLNFSAQILELYLQDKQSLILISEAVFALIDKGFLDPSITEFEFESLPDAMQDIKNGTNTGSLVLKIY
jgi:NADPH2:quinone reductase